MGTLDFLTVALSNQTLRSDNALLTLSKKTFRSLKFESAAMSADLCSPFCLPMARNNDLIYGRKTLCNTAWLVQIRAIVQQSLHSGNDLALSYPPD
jgi:hypothetical protein